MKGGARRAQDQGRSLAPPRAEAGAGDTLRSSLVVGAQPLGGFHESNLLEGETEAEGGKVNLHTRVT